MHPDHRNYAQWIQMTEQERELHRRDVAQLYVDIARRFEHGAIFVRHHTPAGLDDVLRVVELIRRISGDEFAILLGGDTTYGIPNGQILPSSVS